jgi:uncharacterized protein (TIGR04255 family)
MVMEKTRYYTRSPIVEARIDIRVKHSPKMEVASLMEMATTLESEYAIQEQLFNLQNSITMDSTSNTILSSSASNNPIGYSFLSNTKQSAIQARLDGFTFSHFTPYPGWDIFRENGLNLWNIYRRITNPMRIDSIAVRYVNRIDIPSLRIELKDYLRTVPEVSPDLPEALLSYMMYLQIPIEEINSIAHITQTSLPPPSSDVISIALDINIINQGTIAQETEDILATLDLIHIHADRVFEASITDITRGLIK